MKYRLRNERDKNLTLLLQALKNRGVEDIEHYLHVNDNDIQDPLTLAGMAEGVNMLLAHANRDSKTFLLVDADADGYTSASVLYNYCLRVWPEWISNSWEYYLHEGKQHGLNDCCDFILANNYNLVIVPDAGTNDHVEIQKLKDNGCDILILDHHEGDYRDNNAVVINNQLCDYTTKSLSGAGVVYKFCQQLDIVLGVQYADLFLDLVAIGLVADMMDLRDCETHRLVEKGLNTIRAPFIDAIVEKNSYSLKGHLNPKGVSFYIAPVINAVTRVGSLKEKEILFRALLDNYANKQCPSGKRGHVGELVPLVDEALRIASNVRSRQNKARDSKFNAIVEQIEKEGLTENKIIAVRQSISTDDEKGITGLVANQTMAKYKRPVLILSPTNQDDGLHWSGSGRNAPNCGLDDFRTFLLDTGLVDFSQGHASAFGTSIADSKFEEFINKTNELLASYDFSAIYNVDDIISVDDLNSQDIIAVSQAKDLWTQGIEEPLIAVEKIKINLNSVFVNEKVLKITAPNGVSFVKFKPTAEELMLFSTLKDSYTMDVVGTCNFSDYDSTAQILITDYNLNKVVFWDF